MAFLVAIVLWSLGFTVYWKVMERSRYELAFENEVWHWTQLSRHPRTLDPQERWKLITQLASHSPPERWSAAGELASWREPAALRPLIGAMQDDDGTRRTCVLSQALGKLGDPAAIPALIRAAQHPSNLDLRICATHALGQIGDENAAEFLAKRATDPSVSDGERAGLISALGEIGLPLALPTLESIRSSNPLLISFTDSAIKQIALLRGDATGNLLTTLGDNTDWIIDDWVLTQLYLRWDDRIGAALNERLRADFALKSSLRLQIAALLVIRQCLEIRTYDILVTSSSHEDRWLASLIHGYSARPSLIS